MHFSVYVPNEFFTFLSHLIFLLSANRAINNCIYKIPSAERDQQQYLQNIKPKLHTNVYTLSRQIL